MNCRIKGEVNFEQCQECFYRRQPKDRPPSRPLCKKENLIQSPTINDNEKEG